MNTRLRLFVIFLGALLAALTYTFPLWQPFFLREQQSNEFPGLGGGASAGLFRTADQSAPPLPANERPEQPDGTGDPHRRAQPRRSPRARYPTSARRGCPAAAGWGICGD
ncbi:hypothetical protein HC928_24105 [bacterium]|nr:hypothetical protein [bacterium]